MDDKQFEASDKKKEDEKKKGNVPKSQEFTGVFLLIIGFFLTLFSFQANIDNIKELFYITIGFSEHYQAKNIVPIKFLKDNIWLLVTNFLYIFSPIAISIFLMAIAVNIAQFGILFTPLKIDFSKINIINGMKNFITAKKAIDFFKLFFKLIIALVVYFSFYWAYQDDLIILTTLNFYWSIDKIYDLFFILLSIALFIIFIFAFVDLILTRHFHFKKLKMSFQDLKDEHKQTDGDPLIKQRIRETQRKLASESAMKDTSEASFVVTNPTHYAVAVRYKPELGDDVPKIVSKGVDFLALRIKNIAVDNNVKIIEDPPLARALYAQTEVGQMVPMEFFKPVAELINYVNNLNNRGS